MQKPESAIQFTQYPYRGIFVEAARLLKKRRKTVHELYRRGNPAVRELIKQLAEKRRAEVEEVLQ